MPLPYDEIMKTKPYLPFRMGHLTDTMVAKAEEELGETDEAKAKTIPELRKMAEDDPKLACPTDDAYMLQYLRARKYSAKRAFSLLQNYHQVKKSYADLFDFADVERLRQIFRCKALSCFPYRDDDGCVIYLMQMGKWDPDEISMAEACIALTFLLLLCIEDSATQVCGMQILLDVRGAAFKQFKSFTPRYMNLISKALRNCLPIRFKGIHIFNESVIFGYIWAVFKLLLSEKIKKRVHFHGDNQKHLHKFIPKAVLPSEYGGEYTDFSGSDWTINQIETFFERFKELTTYGYRD